MKLRDMETPTVLGYELDRNTLLPVRRPITGPIVMPSATDADRALLAQHGMDGLKAMGFHGVIDRLSRT